MQNSTISRSDKSKWWTADFETTSLQNLEKDGYVRVWLWSLVGVEKGEEAYGFNIESFFETIKSKRLKKVLFLVVHF